MKLAILEDTENSKTIAQRLNDTLKTCKTCEDFEKLKSTMYDYGLGFWFYTKKGHQELNSIHTRIETTSGFTRYYSANGKPITKNGEDCIAYDTVRNPTTRIISIRNAYRYIYIA